MSLAPSAATTVVRRWSTPPWGVLRRRLLGISPGEAGFARRGFVPGAPATQRRLEEIGATFVTGYLAGLEADAPESVGTALAEISLVDRGFAFEGAAMAMALMDLITPWRHDRFDRFLHGPGAPHVYLAHVGAGWALARLSRTAGSALLKLDPLLRWLVLDGYGFHEGYFEWRRVIVGQRRPGWLRGYETRAFDQGLGRSLWFVECGDAGRITHRVETFVPSRHSDLWSGIGLAAAYAGGVPGETLAMLRDAAGEHGAHVAQGAAFAAQARERAGNPAAHTNLACEVFTGRTAAVLARVTEQALDDISANGQPLDYEAWRRSIRERIPLNAARHP